jgi:hypothetical protein
MRNEDLVARSFRDIVGSRLPLMAGPRVKRREAQVGRGGGFDHRTQETGRAVTLSEELGHLERQTAAIEGVETRLSDIASGYKALKSIRLAWTR